MPGYISAESENTNLKKYTYPNIHNGITYNSEDTETTQLSLNRQLD